MRTYEDIRLEIIKFLNQNNISAYDLVRVGKDLCCCRTCTFFIQHYSKEGHPFDFGHCIKNRTPSATRPNSASCGSWTLCAEDKL